MDANKSTILYRFIKIVLLGALAFGAIFIIKAVMDKENEQYANLRGDTGISESLRGMQNWQPVEGVILSHSSTKKQTFYRETRRGTTSTAFGGKHT
ncbi:MAG: hypothetical protein KUG73_16790, partial [Pseudomonadales bacterium]|nr:hypothetical protein [Pseudomonadales bacterium]